MNAFSKPLTNLLLLMGYSTVFIVLNGSGTMDAVGIHWAFIIVHVVALCVAGFVLLFRTEVTRGNAKQCFLSMVLVLLIGHGLCFFNGLMNLNLH